MNLRKSVAQCIALLCVIFFFGAWFGVPKGDPTPGSKEPIPAATGGGDDESSDDSTDDDSSSDDSTDDDSSSGGAFAASSGGAPRVASTPDAPSCPKDINQDGFVNVMDLIDLFPCLGRPASPGCQAEDVNDDLFVDVLDMIDVLIDFGTECPVG